MTCRRTYTGLPTRRVVHMADWSTLERDTRRAHWLSEALALVLCAWGVVGVLAWIGGWI